MHNRLSVAPNVALTIFFVTSNCVPVQVVAGSNPNIQHLTLATVILVPQSTPTPSRTPGTVIIAPGVFPSPSPTVTPQPTSTPSDAQTGTGSTPSFWSTAPGVLTAVAAFISAVAALIAALTRRS